MYKVDPRRGVVVVINNWKNFDAFVDRKGSSKDSSTIYEFFNGLNFGKIKERSNLTCDQVTKMLKEESEKISPDASCLVCVISSYGGDGFIYGKGGVNDMMEVDKIMEHFKGYNCEPLVDKPKLFFIQTCPKKLKEQYDSPTPDTSNTWHKIPVEADQLLVHSCIPGDLVLDDDTKTQSWFISTVKEAITGASSFKKDAKSDLLSMLTKMNRKSAQKLSQNPTVTTNNRVKLPYISSTLRKDLFFEE